METFSDPQLPQQQPAVIGYAEPSTRARLTPAQWLARRWFSICAKTLLIFALIIIGGTVGSMNLNFEPAMPWEGSLIIQPAVNQTALANPMTMAQFHDLITPDLIEQLLSKAYSKALRLGTVEIKQRIDVSSVSGPDHSFTITVRGSSGYGCDGLSREFYSLLKEYTRKQGIHFEIVWDFARQTKVAKLAPTLNMLVGAGIGVLVAAIIIRFSNALSSKANRLAAT